MNEIYVNSIDLLDRVAAFTSGLASIGVKVKAICFCEPTAAEIFRLAEHQGRYFCEKPQSRVNHVVSHGTIDGVRITSPGEENE